jgi:cell wall-associated NlpC family hydrolase
MKNKIRNKKSRSVIAILTCAALAFVFALPPGGGAANEAFAAKSAKTTKSVSRMSPSDAGKGISKGRYVIRPAVSGTRVVTVRGGSKKSGANIYMYSGDMAKNQLFDVSFDSKGRALIKNVKSKKYVSVSGGKAKKGANVVQASKSSSKGQRWILEPAGKDHGQIVYRVRSALSSKYYLQLSGGKDRNAANIRLWTRNKSKAEKFAFVNVKAVAEPAAAPVIADGIYKIGNSLSSALTFAVPDGAAKSGVAPALETNSSSLAQLFIFTYEDGYYRVRSLVSGKSLSIKDGNVLAHMNAVQYNDASKSYQRFKLVKKNAGTYQMIVKAGGMALRVASGTAAAGRTLETYYPSTSKSQKFKITPVESVKLSAGVYNISPHAREELNLSSGGSDVYASTPLSIEDDDRGFAQKFRLTIEADDSYSIQNLGSQLMLTASGSDVIQAAAPEAGPSPDQLWSAELSVGGMRFISKSTGKAMRLTGGEGAYGIDLAAPSDSVKQAFIPDKTKMFDTGQYRVDSRAGFGSLAVEDASFFALADILTGGADGSGAQAWLVSENADGTLTIRNSRSGKPMETSKSVAGGVVRQNKSSRNAKQKWILEESGDGWYTLSSASGSEYHYLSAGTGVTDGGGYTELTTAPEGPEGDTPDSIEWRFVPVKVTKAGPAMPEDAADAVEKEARKHLGKKYVFGAEGPNTFDCSGYIYYVMNHSGVKEMSRVTAQDIYDSCIKISKGKAKRGDLIFFKNTYKTDRLVTHLGIYLGDGRMIHAGSPVQVSKVDTKYFKAHFYAYGRMP